MDEKGQWRWKKFLWKYTLEYDGTVYSVINRRRIFSGGYWDLFLPFIAIYEKPDVLMIGLGGGTVIFEARSVFHDSFNMDIVEISGESVKKAAEMINIENEKVIIGDGFEFLLRNNKKYDLIILDAYRDRRIPEKFISQDFFLASFNSLKDNGILLVNYALNIYGRVKLKDFRIFAGEYFNTFRIGPTLIEENIIVVCSKEMGIDELKLKIRALETLPKWLKRRTLKIKNF